MTHSQTLKTSTSVALVLLVAHTAQAQNSSGGNGTWNSTAWSNGTPDRADGTQTLVNSSGETVQIISGHTITIDGSSSHGSGTLQYTGTNTTPLTGGGTGYVDTSSQLNVVDGTITMSGKVQFDVGMAHGGVYLAGTGTVETAAGGGTGTNGDSHLSTSYGGAVDAQYRDVSYWHQNDPVDNQLYIPTDIYAPVHADAAAATTTTDELPLYGAGGHLHIGDTGSTTGTFNMEGGILNVVQYGWGWGADSIDGVSYDAASASSYNGTTDTWTGANPAIQNSTYTSRFEGYLLDDSNGAWDVTSGTTIDNEAGTSRMWVDASELDNAYYHNGDANNSSLSNIYTDVGAGNGTFIFDDPPIDSTVWSSESNTGPYGDETATAPAGMTDPDGDGVAALVDYYHTIGRTGGNIRVGNSDSSVGVFNITDGIVTTNNIELGRLADAKGTVNQTGGDIFTRESITIGSYSRTNLGQGSDGVYNFGNNAANGMDATTIFNNSTGDGEDGGSNTIDGDAQYYGRTSTGFEFGDGIGGDSASSTNYAPGSDGGGVLEIAANLNIGTRGQGVFNLNAADTFTWTNPDTGATETRDSHMAVGGEIRLGVQGGDQDVYSVFNFDSSIDLLASGRTANNIIIGMSRNTGNDPQANDSVGIFNYNPTAGQIGSLDPNLFQVEGNTNNGNGRNEWDGITVGRGEGATGYFNHNNEKTIFVDSSVIIGEWRESNGVFNLLGQPDAATYNAATGSSLSAANNEMGGLEIDDWLYVGLRGNGVMNQTGQTDVAMIRQTADHTSGQQILDIQVGFYDESTSNGRSNGDAAPIDRDNAYGEYNFGLPDAGDNMVHSGSSVVGASRADSGSNNLGTTNTPTISEVRNINIGVQGEGVFNYYADTANLAVDNNINLGQERTGTGVFNIVSDNGVTVSSGTVGNGDIHIGESGTGIFNQGTFNNNNDPGLATAADGTTGQNSTVDTNGGNIVLGGARSYTVDRNGYVSQITDSGGGTYNLNGTGADINLGGGGFSDEGHSVSGKISIGTGDNVQEGIMYRDLDSSGSNLADTQNITVGLDTYTVVRDARNPWGNASQDDHATGAWLAESGENADEQQLGTGTLFGTATTFGTDNAVTDINGNAVTLNKFAGYEDGQGSLGEFNHNNDVNLFLNQGDITIADGDNSQGLFNQNGTGDVKMLGSLEMSVDRFDTGDATVAAPNAAALAAATAGSAATQFEMGQSTYSVNNANAVLNLNAQDVIGDSVDASGRGTEVNDTYGAGVTKGNLQNRTNEAQINLYDGAINNSRNVRADVVQYGGRFDMDEAGVSEFVTTDLRTGNHDFIQQEVGPSYTNPLTGSNTTSSTAPTIAFDTDSFDGLLDLNSDISATTPTNSGTVNSDTLAADFIRLNGASGSIELDFSSLLTGSDYLGAANGQYWNLLDWNSGFDWSPDAGGRGQAAFDFGLGAGVLPTLGLDSETGEQLVWSIDESATSMPDLWSTHGIIYIALDITYVPEPSSTALLGLGLSALMLRRRRS